MLKFVVQLFLTIIAELENFHFGNQRHTQQVISIQTLQDKSGQIHDASSGLSSGTIRQLRNESK